MSMGAATTETVTHLRRARLYQTLRTAHLEQAHELSPATILFRAKRYDFEEAATAGLDLVRAGPIGTAWYLFASDVTEIEINEPLMRYGIRGAALALFSLHIRDLFKRRRTLVVTYAIENLDPFLLPRRTLRGRIRDRIDRALTHQVWRRIDRIVYGTQASRDLYARVLPVRRRPLDDILIPTLPQPCYAESLPRLTHRVVFLGALSERKGFHLVMDAWDRVVEQRPNATLLIMGKGDLEDVAIAWAAHRDEVTIVIDPERAEIHRQLRVSQVLTLPSQSEPTWKEQLGLPITEALSHGVSIVSTSETGIAEWLRQNGHSTINSTATSGELADAIARMLANPLPEADVIASLPDRDGRLAADDWMFRTA